MHFISILFSVLVIYNLFILGYEVNDSVTAKDGKRRRTKGRKRENSGSDDEAKGNHRVLWFVASLSGLSIIILTDGTPSKNHKRSFAWNYFTKSSPILANCNLCKIDIKCLKGSTSGLINHLKSKLCLYFYPDIFSLLV